MTNNMNLTTALTVVACEMGNHLRIGTMIMTGHTALALNLLTERMEGMIRDFAQGEVYAEGNLLDALEVINNSFGPLVILQTRLVALKQIDTLKSAIASLN